jgi:hypothetical protein
MSTMPNAHVAEVSEAKILGYLLNAAHPEGAGKAAFFRAMGYRRARWRSLGNALADVATTGIVRAVATTEHGTKDIIDGVVVVPRGGASAVRTVWIIDHGAEVPRLVTAYPVEVGDDERA